MSALPLQGRRVLVTRAAHQAGKLSDALRALGVTPVEVPVLEIQPPENFEPLDTALANFGRYDWLILSSANTVHALHKRAAQLSIPFRQPDSMKIAAVGQATAAAAQDLGLQITLVPESYVAESLIQALAGLVRGKTALLARAAVARDLLPDALRQAGARVDVVDAYRNVLPASAPALLHHALEERIDAVTLTSSSSASHLLEAASAAGIAWPFAGVPAISIGPITSATLRELRWEPAAEASPSDIPGLVAAVERTLRSS